MSLQKMTKYSKIDPDYLYLNEAALKSEAHVFMTTDARARGRKARSSSRCAALVIFLLFASMAVLTFFYVAPMIRWHRYHSTYYYSQQSDSDAHHGYDIQNYQEESGRNRHFLNLFLDFIHGLSWRGKMCLRRCFREHGQCLPGEEHLHSDPLQEEDASGTSREKRLWDLMIQRSAVHLTCLKRCERFAFMSESNTDGDSSATDDVPHVIEKHWMVARLRGRPLMRRVHVEPLLHVDKPEAEDVQTAKDLEEK